MIGLSTVRDDLVVAAIRALADYVASNIGIAAVRQVNAVAAGAVFVVNAIVRYRVVRRAAFHLVAANRVVRIAVRQRKILDGSNVDVMGLPITRSVVIELAVRDRDGAGSGNRRIAEDAVLIVMEIG